LYAQDGYDVLAVDADANPTLASAFGIPLERSPKPLIEMKELIAERTGTGKNAVGSYFRINPKVGDLPQEYSIKAADSVKLLVLGGITQAGAGCACPQGAFLKAMLTHIVLQRNEMVLVDLAAGVECMGRAAVQGIDGLVVVVEPGGRSIETADSFAGMARQLGIKATGAIANKITDDAQTKLIESRMKGVPLLGNIRYDKAISDADLKGEPVFKVGGQLVDALKNAKDKLAALVREQQSAGTGYGSR
jgi:CO dehydrogenase maturation factor